MTTYTQQQAAVEAARRIISGAAKPPRPSERPVLLTQLDDAAETLSKLASSIKGDGGRR